MSIYVVSHKPLVTKLNNGYVAMFVGSKKQELLASFPLSTTDDCIGDELASKNSLYCELTALNAINQRSNDLTELVGLVHYRRRFLKTNMSILEMVVCKKMRRTKFLQKRLPSYELQYHEALNLIVNDNSIIVPKATIFSESLFNHYSRFHNASDLDILRDAIYTIHPSYINSYDAVMSSHKAFLFNMFISRAIFVKNYWTWLREVLEVVESQIPLVTRDAYQQRTLGFMAERLFNVYLKHNSDIVPHEQQIIFTG